MSHRKTVTRLVVPACAVLTLTGCVVPRAPFDIGTQAAPVALVLGEHAAVVAAPVGPISVALPPSLAPFLPVESAVGSPPALPDPPTPLTPCPDYDPLAPVSAVGLNLPGPPVPATYAYRAKTTDSVGNTKATFTGNSSWKVTVSPPDATTGGYRVTTDVRIGKSSTQRVLLVLPKPATQPQTGDTPLDAPDATDPNAQVIDLYNSLVGPYGFPTIPRAAPNVGRYGPAGIYLVSQTTGSSTFTPTVPIPLVQTPIGKNSFTAIGTDGVTVMRFVSTVTKKALVNACGQKLEATQVALTEGIVAGPNSSGQTQAVTFEETLDFGLQFGGLPLRDVGKVTGSTAAGGSVVPGAIERTFDFTINTTPKRLR